MIIEGDSYEKLIHNKCSWGMEDCEPLEQNVLIL